MRTVTRFVGKLSFVFVWLMAGQAHAVPVAIVNPSFEDPAFGDGGFFFGIPGYVAPGDQGVFNPSSGQLPAPPDGVQVGFSNGGTISQVLAEAVAADTLYTLRVDMSPRLDCCAFPGATIQLVADGDVRASTPVASLSSGVYTTIIASFFAGSGDANLGDLLQIRLISAGGQSDFDNLRLDAVRRVVDVPIPATLLLVGPGVLGLAGLAWRRRRRS